MDSISKRISKHPEYPLYIGVVITLLSFITSWLLFRRVPNFISISTLMFTVVLSVPIVAGLFTYEEKEVRKRESFFRKHRVIIDFFVYFFIGVFFTLFILALIFPGKILSESQFRGEPSQIEKTISTQYKNLPPPPSIPQVEISGIIKNNLYVMTIAFILSLFYGAGALFLVVLNASIFASALADIVRLKIPSGFLSSYAFMGCQFGVMFFHMLPEVAGYLFAAIAGGVMSKAVVKEKWMSKQFFKVLQDAFAMLAIGIVLIITAGIIEILISKKLFKLGVCLTNTLTLLVIFAIIIISVVIFEVYRRKT